MESWQLLIVYVALAVAAAFLSLWMRRDRGADPVATSDS
jgi:hypothetical protein